MSAAPEQPQESRAAIVRDAVAVGVATGAYGISFGAIAVSAGLSVPQACALSLLVFTGASQFALVGVLASAAHRCPAPSPPCCSAPATPSTASGWRRSSAGGAGAGPRPRTS